MNLSYFRLFVELDYRTLRSTCEVGIRSVLYARCTWLVEGYIVLLFNGDVRVAHGPTQNPWLQCSTYDGALRRSDCVSVINRFWEGKSSMLVRFTVLTRVVGQHSSLETRWWVQLVPWIQTLTNRHFTLFIMVQVVLTTLSVHSVRIFLESYHDRSCGVRRLFTAKGRNGTYPSFLRTFTFPLFFPSIFQ